MQAPKSPQQARNERLDRSTSTVGETSPKTRTQARAPRRRLLKEYYQLDGKTSKDPLDLDSSDFDVKATYDQLASTLSIPDLLKRQTDLANEIRELDSERQALVYNHHHELIEASDTIRKMSARASSLDGALDSLASALESINQLSASLAAATPPIGQRSRAEGDFDPLLHLPEILSLPTRLRHLLATSSGRDEAHLLWGQHVETLRAWESAGVVGAREVSNECRDVLASARRGSHSDVK